MQITRVNMNITACAKPSNKNNNFTVNHKAAVKDLFKKIQNRGMERFKSMNDTKSIIKKDLSEFHIDTLKLLNSELISKIEELENPDESKETPVDIEIIDK